MSPPAWLGSRSDNEAGEDHGLARGESSFTTGQLDSAYRALRSSVLRLWALAQPLTTATDFGDIIRFGEAVDQLLAASVFSFTNAKSQAEETERKRRNQFLAIPGHELRNPLSPITAAATILKKVKREDAINDNMSTVITRQVTAHVGTICTRKCQRPRAGDRTRFAQCYTSSYRARYGRNPTRRLKSRSPGCAPRKVSYMKYSTSRSSIRRQMIFRSSRYMIPSWFL